MIRKGQIVHIKQEWQDAGDDTIVFVAANDEDGGRVEIIATNLGLHIAPRQIVETRMLCES
jgi:hypothetical protein